MTEKHDMPPEPPGASENLTASNEQSPWPRPGAFQISGLVDSGCKIVGYRESLLQDVNEAPRHIGRLLAAFGVAAVRDEGSGMDAVYRFARSSPSPSAVIGGGPLLVEGEARMEGHRPLKTEEDIRRTLDSLEAEGVRWLSVQPETVDFLAAVHALARERDMKVAARGGVAVEGALRGFVDLLEGAALLATGSAGLRGDGGDGRAHGQPGRGRGGGSGGAGDGRAHGHGRVRQNDGNRERACGPIDVLSAISDSNSAEVRDRLHELAEMGVACASGLLALRRAVFVKESLAAPFLDELPPIVPHTRYLLEMRRAGGYLMGKRSLEHYSGLREPRANEKQRVLDGWERLLEIVSEAHDLGMLILPASRSPQMAVVPGYSLFEEMAVLVHGGIPAEEVLMNASDRARNFYGITGGAVASPTGSDLPEFVLQAGRPPETPEDILNLNVVTGTAAAGGTRQ